MHTVELLEFALAAARAAGYQIREDWLGGSGGGACLLKGRKWLVLDLAQDHGEQLAQVADALRGETGLDHVEMPAELRQYLDIRRSA